MEDKISKRIERFLLQRGIACVKKDKKGGSSRSRATSQSLSASASPSLSPSQQLSHPRSRFLNQTLRDIDDIDIDFDDERVVDYFGLSRVESNPDADEFYSEVADPDKHEYVALKSHRDRRYSREPITDLDFDEEDEEEDEDECHKDRSNENAIDTDSDTDSTSDTDSGSGSDIDSICSVLPITSQQGFKNWEFHDPTTAKEISSNGGVYDPFRPDLFEVEPNDPFAMSRLAPAAKYRDLLQLKHIGIRKLHQLDNSRKYKNNLSEVLDNRYLITCSSSELIIYEFDSNQIPKRIPVLRFDVRPDITHTFDRLASTWPYFPHTINYIKVSEFLGKKVLGACMDDGLIQIWYVETILEQIQRFKNKSNVTNNDGIEEVRVEIRRDDTAASIVESVVSREELERNQRDRELTPGSTDDDELSSQFIYLTNRFFGLKIKPEFTLKMGSSCWGLDFLPSHNMLVASDNCQNITLFYYDPYDERFYHVATHQLLHNIPEVAFLDQTDDDDNKVRVSCSSISGEILIFEFGFTHVSGPLNFEDFDVFRNEKIYCIDPGMISLSVSINNNISDVQRSLRFSRISWDTPKVIRRVLLGEDCWTCKPIAANYFKPVQSIRAMIGDPWLDEDSEIREILRESKILNREYDPIRTSHLGAGAKWQFFEASVLKLEEGTNYEDSELFESATLTGIDDTYRRIKKGILREEKSKYQGSKTNSKSLNGRKYINSLEGTTEDSFICISTSKRLGLFRSDSLFCTSATRNVFDVSIPFNDDSKFSNRISITQVIPELLCFLALTQQGLVTVMRLCQHRGLFGMRQEYLFPNALSLALSYNGYRTITGLACRNMSADTSLPRYFIYLTYSDGVCLTYELRLGKNDELEVEMI